MKTAAQPEDLPPSGNSGDKSDLSGKNKQNSARSTNEKGSSIFLKVPLVVYEALLVTVVIVVAAVGYMLFSRCGLGVHFSLAPVEFMDADTHHSVLQPIAELPVPPGAAGL